MQQNQIKQNRTKQTKEKEALVPFNNKGQK